MAPRTAFAIAGDARFPGRSGSDLIVAIVLTLLATQLGLIVQAIAFAIKLDVGVSGFAKVVNPLGVPLAVLVISAGVIWAAEGKRRDLGRAFDLAAVAVLPILVVMAVASLVHQLLEVEVPTWLASVIAYGWTAGLVALVMFDRKSARPAQRRMRVAGRAVLVLAGAGIALQTIWILDNPDLVLPMTAGKPAPAIALRAIGPHGEPGDEVALAPGRVMVVDFWASWCQPCMRSLPKLDAFARRHPEVQVVTIALDHFDDARSVFDEHGYVMSLLGDDGHTSQRYGVGIIPHTVVIDRRGLIHKVHVGDGLDLEKELSTL